MDRGLGGMSKGMSRKEEISLKKSCNLKMVLSMYIRNDYILRIDFKIELLLVRFPQNRTKNTTYSSS